MCALRFNFIAQHEILIQNLSNQVLKQIT